MVVRILCGDKIAEAASRAGYSPSTRKGTIYRMMKSPGVKERIEEIRKDTEMRDSLVLDELIEEGLGTFMKSMRELQPHPSDNSSAPAESSSDI